ncbi:MAG: hypothetical protein ACE37N_02280 [Pseudohongiellaceae bacterium]|jgi:hypothetical protein
MDGVNSAILHQEKLIKTVFSGPFETDRLVNYFANILDQVKPDAQYLEDVDFRAVTEFKVSYADFGPYSKQAAEMYTSGRVRKTVFHVSDELQYGMARLFASSTGMDDSFFEIIRHDG